jgi:hypothetical protein
MHEGDVRDETKEDVRMSARKKWYSPPYKPSRQLDMTQEERAGLARYLRWNRSLKRVAPPGSPYTGEELYVGRGTIRNSPLR